MNILLQGRDVGDSCMNVTAARGAGADHVESTGMRIRAEGKSSNPETRQDTGNPSNYQKGTVCAKLSVGLTLIRESPIAPAQHILFFVICT